ncbi:restriction endonuclease subunit S [Ligilactobacillus salivarius]|uniref:restriction endonuclease subunit S n=1 Tax=Ligilactobacillus salivarius TaxID=1624 RepID=UPI003F25D172
MFPTQFTGASFTWERKKLGIYVPITMGQSPNSKNYTSNPRDNILVQGNADLYNNRVLKRTFTTEVTKTADKDDILMSVRAPVGDIARNQYESIVIGRGIAAIKGNNFLYYQLEKMNNSGFWKKYIAGSTFESINGKDLKSSDIYISNYKEEKSIGNIFQTLTKTIQLHERKCEELILIKKALLQKLFPKRDEVRSEVRYKNFSDAWKQRKLRDVVKTTIGEFVIKTKQKEDSPYPVYNGGTSYTGFYDDYNNDSNKIIISARGANAGFVNIVRQRYWAGNSCYSLSILNNQEMDLDYLYQMLKQRQHLFTDFQQAANIPSVSKKDVETFKVYTPSFEEQKKIGLFLTRFDSLIDLHQRKLEKLKQLKKFLLQNMFI